MSPPQPTLEKKAYPNDSAIEHAGLQGLWGREKSTGLISSGSSPPGLGPSPTFAVSRPTLFQVLWVLVPEPQRPYSPQACQGRTGCPAHSEKILLPHVLKGTAFLSGPHLRSEWEDSWASERRKFNSGNFKSQRIPSTWWRESLFCLSVGRVGVGSWSTFSQQKQYSE